jgi:hypothetical protein
MSTTSRTLLDLAERGTQGAAGAGALDVPSDAGESPAMDYAARFP